MAIRYFFELTGRYFLYSFLLLSVNSVQKVFAADVDSDFKDATVLFERRDMVSTARAITLLEKILEKKSDHLETQALISYAYIHEAFIMTQLGEKATEYQNSAEAFSKAVLAQQPQNVYARKTALFLQLLSNNQVDARKILERDVTEKETDADLWYMLAAVSEGSRAPTLIAKALSLNPNHVWIYTDMALRALKLGDVAVAEKWVKALESRQGGLAEVDLLRSVIAAQKKDKSRALKHWTDFSKKAPDFALVGKFSPGSKK